MIDPSASVQAGMRGSLYAPSDIGDARDMGFTVLSTIELLELGPAGYGELVRERVGDRPAFLSFDVDFCDPAYTPGTGTPEIGGPTSGAGGRVRACADRREPGRVRRGRGVAVVRLARPADRAPRREHRLGDDLAPRPRARAGRRRREALLRRRRARLGEVLAQVPERRQVLRGRHADHGRRHHRQDDGAGRRDGRRPPRGPRPRPARDRLGRRARGHGEADPLQRLLPVPLRPGRVRPPERRHGLPRGDVHPPHDRRGAALDRARRGAARRAPASAAS